MIYNILISAILKTKSAYPLLNYISCAFKDLKDEVSLWVLFSRACSAVTYISNTTLVKSA